MGNWTNRDERLTTGPAPCYAMAPNSNSKTCVPLPPTRLLGDVRGMYVTAGGSQPGSRVPDGHTLGHDQLHEFFAVRTEFARLTEP